MNTLVASIIDPKINIISWNYLALLNTRKEILDLALKIKNTFKSHKKSDKTYKKYTQKKSHQKVPLLGQRINKKERKEN